MRRRELFILAGGAAAGLAVGVGLGLWRVTPGTPALKQDALFSANFTDMNGKPQNLASWQGKVMVLNFWATWCPPCRREIPDFIKFDAAYRDRGVNVIGIALDERDKVVPFAQEFGIHYPLLLGNADTYDLTENLGNKIRGLPFTAIIDKQGKVAYVGLGAMHFAELEKAVLPLLQ